MLQDILNHVIEDLEGFIHLLKTKAAAWTELEKKKKKSKRRKHDGKIDSMPQTAPIGEGLVTFTGFLGSSRVKQLQ